MSEEGDKKFHKLTCSNCRKKKAKCDRSYPFCMNCKNSKKKCVYDKPASISYVRHLEKQVEQLERQVRAYEGVDDKSTPGSTDSALNFRSSLKGGNRQVRDPNEGLEFNVDNLIALMTDLDIKGAPQTNSNISSVPFAYISDTIRFNHYFHGPLSKSSPDYYKSGTYLIKVVTSIRQKYSSGESILFLDTELIKSNVLMGLSVSSQAFPYFRPHYINKYYRDFMEVVDIVMNFLEVNSSQDRRNKFGYDSAELVQTFAMAAKSFYRVIVSPFLLISPKSPEEKEETDQKIQLYVEETQKIQKEVLQLIGQNLFSPINPSIVQSCIHASLTEVMIGGSLNTAVLLNNFSSRLAIELFEHYTSTHDSVSTIWFLRVLWSSYIWDKIISSCCNKNPTFPNPPPLSPSDMEFNAMDTLPSIDQDGEVILEVDARPAIIVTCRLSIVLSDVLLRRHYFTNVRVHLYEVVDEITSSLPEELTPEFDVVWDRPLIVTDPTSVIKLPKNYPVELILPIAMSIVIKLELYCESFVNLAESHLQSTTKSNKNTLENEFDILQKLMETLKTAAAFALLVSDVGPYKHISAAVAYINPWYRLQLMKSLYKVLLNDESVKFLVLVTDEIDSNELSPKGVVPAYEFEENPDNVVLEMPISKNDDSLPAELFTQNIVFAFNGSSNFKDEQTKDRHYYLKFMISMYIAVAQLSVRRLSEFTAPLSREVLAQSLVTRPTILDVFSEQRKRVANAVSSLPNPKFDGDMDEAYDYEILTEMINKLGSFGDTLLKKRQKQTLPIITTPNSLSTTTSGQQSSSSLSSNKVTPTESPTMSLPIQKVTHKSRGVKRQGICKSDSKSSSYEAELTQQTNVHPSPPSQQQSNNNNLVTPNPVLLPDQNTTFWTNFPAQQQGLYFYPPQSLQPAQHEQFQQFEQSQQQHQNPHHLHPSSISLQEQLQPPFPPPENRDRSQIMQQLMIQQMISQQMMSQNNQDRELQLSHKEEKHHYPQIPIVAPTGLPEQHAIVPQLHQMAPEVAYQQLVQNQLPAPLLLTMTHQPFGEESISQQHQPEGLYAQGPPPPDVHQQFAGITGVLGAENGVMEGAEFAAFWQMPHSEFNTATFNLGAIDNTMGLSNIFGTCSVPEEHHYQE